MQHIYYVYSHTHARIKLIYSTRKEM